MRRGRAKRQELQRAFQNLASLPIYTDMTSDTTIFTTLVSFAERHRLSVYDAAYLELALRSHPPLATIEGDIRAAAVSAGVTVLK